MNRIHSINPVHPVILSDVFLFSSENLDHPKGLRPRGDVNWLRLRRARSSVVKKLALLPIRIWPLIVVLAERTQRKCVCGTGLFHFARLNHREISRERLLLAPVKSIMAAVD